MNANKTAFLKLLNEAETRTYALNAEQEAVIGRESSCQVVLDSTRYGNVSRRHAMIQYRPESLSFEISDLGSSNGTFVNGQRLFNSQLLKSGDRIQLGSTGVLFSFDDPALPATVVRSGGNQLTVPEPVGVQHVVSPSPYAVQSPQLPPAVGVAAPGRKNSIGKVTAITGGVLLLGLLAVFYGGRELLSDRLSSAPSTSPPTLSEQPADSATSANTQSINDPNGLFQVELPEGYQTESRADGINLSSTDGSFQGAITAIRATQQFTADELIQGFTDQQNGNSNLENFKIQSTETIDEGVRIDWVARLSSVNSELDAVTHFLQQGNVVVEVDLFSVDRPFSQQDADEANVILRSLRVNP